MTINTVDDGVAVSSDYAYVPSHFGAEGNFGYVLSVIDVSTPSTPVEVGFIDRPPGANDVSVDGGYALLGSHGSGLYIVRDCAEHGPEKMPYPYPYQSSVD